MYVLYSTEDNFPGEEFETKEEVLERLEELVDDDWELGDFKVVRALEEYEIEVEDSPKVSLVKV